MKYLTFTLAVTLSWLVAMYALARTGAPPQWQWIVSTAGAIGVCVLLVRTVDYCLGPRPRYSVEILDICGDWVDAGVGTYPTEADAQEQIDFAESILPHTIQPLVYRVVEVPRALSDR